MSGENVEIMRAGFEAWNAGDMGAIRDLYDPHAIMKPPEGWPEPGPFMGREAVMRQWAQQRDTFSLDTVEAIGDFIDAGDRVVVRQIWRGSGHGPVADFEMTSIYTLRKGRVVSDEKFWDHAEVLEILELSAQGAHD